MKKLLSFVLTLALCFGLAAPAFAASDLTGAQLYPVDNWNDGPSLTLTGVTGERAVEMELPYCYDVAVGGSLVLDMPYPAGKNRGYTLMVTGVYISPDFTTYLDNGQKWNVPAESEGGWFNEESGKTQYVYNFTESDMGQVDGFDKAIYIHIYWDESTDGVYASDAGSVYFYVHVVPQEPSAPAGVGGFKDVDASSPYADGIAWAVEQGITNGTTATTFGPGNTCTIRQILTFLWRANGKPGAAAGQSDLDAAVSWAVSTGIVSSDIDSYANCTREMAVTCMWKAAGSPKPSKTTSFSDVSANADYAQAVAWAVEQGITNGTGGNSFSPDQTCTRGQIVTFLYRGSAN